MAGADSGSAPSVALLLQQLDLVESYLAAAETSWADSGGVTVHVDVEDERGSGGWAEAEAEVEVTGDDELSQYIRSEEEMVELQQLESL